MNKALKFKERDFPKLIEELDEVLNKYRMNNSNDNLYDAFISIARPIKKMS